MSQYVAGNGNMQVGGDFGGIHGQGIQLVTIGGGNSGTIVNGTASFLGSANEAVKYRLTPLGRHANLFKLALPGLIKLGLAVLVGWVQWSGYGSILFSALGVSPAFAMLGLGVFALVLGVRGFYQLAVPFNLIGNARTRHWSRYYERQADNSIAEAFISAECPVRGCSGTISLGRPAQNQEGVGFAGLCSHHGHLHAFEFNDHSYEGNRLFLHPVQQDQRTR